MVNCSAEVEAAAGCEANNVTCMGSEMCTSGGVDAFKQSQWQVVKQSNG